MSSFGRRKKYFIALFVVAALVAVGGGLAYAYWTAGGTGVGSATTGTSTDFTVTSDPPVGGALTPGGGGQTVAFTVANTGTGGQNLTNVTVTVANADGSAWTATAGCSAADYTVGAPTIVYGDIPGAGHTDGTVTITMNDLTTNQDACQGVTVPLYFVAR